MVSHPVKSSSLDALPMPLTQAVRMCRPCCPSSGRPSSGSLRLSRRARSQGSASWCRAVSRCNSSWRRRPRRECSLPPCMSAEPCETLPVSCAADQMSVMQVQQACLDLHASRASSCSTTSAMHVCIILQSWSLPCTAPLLSWTDPLCRMMSAQVRQGPQSLGASRRRPHYRD